MDRNLIAKYVTDKGVPHRYKGFDTLVDAILTADVLGVSGSMMDIYRHVAKKHRSTYQRVERNIRYSLHATKYEGPVSEFIATALYELRLADEEASKCRVR